MSDRHEDVIPPEELQDWKREAEAVIAARDTLLERDVQWALRVRELVNEIERLRAVPAENVLAEVKVRDVCAFYRLVDLIRSAEHERTMDATTWRLIARGDDVLGDAPRLEVRLLKGDQLRFAAEGTPGDIAQKLGHWML